MEDIIYKLIPANPFYELPEELAKTLPAKIAQLATTATLEELAGVQFIDAGEGFHQITCPNCQEKLDPMWWHLQMEKFYSRGQRFFDLAVSTPCCEKKTSLNDLVYDWPQGFASVMVTVANEKEAQTLQEFLQDTTKENWRQIKASY